MTTLTGDQITELEARILDQMYVLTQALYCADTGGRPYDGRESAALSQQRIGQSLATLSLALLRIRRLNESRLRTHLRRIRTQGFSRDAWASDEPIADRSTVILRDARVSDERMPPRRRGAQPGNSNALKHGKRTGAARQRRQTLRRALGTAPDLAREVQRLLSEATALPTSPPKAEEGS